VHRNGIYWNSLDKTPHFIDAVAKKTKEKTNAREEQQVTTSALPNSTWQMTQALLFNYENKQQQLNQLAGTNAEGQQALTNNFGLQQSLENGGVGSGQTPDGTPSLVDLVG
jgi:hypothetical protein